MTMKMAGISGIALAAALAFTAATPSAVSAGSLKDTYEPAPVAMWAGCYLGGNAGGAWQDDGDVKKVKGDWKKKSHDWWSDDYGYYPVDKDDVKHDDDDDVSFIGGLHAGCNWQDGAAVYGVEGDIGFGDNIDYLASLRGRLGWAMDDLLLYLTAGVGFLGADDDFDVSVWSDYSQHWYEMSFEDDHNDVGLVVGGGLEKKLDPNWSIGVEGLYYFFGDDDDKHEWIGECINPHGRGICDKKKFLVEREKDNDIFVVRARLTYHLGEVEEPLPPLK